MKRGHSNDVKSRATKRKRKSASRRVRPQTWCARTASATVARNATAGHRFRYLLSVADSRVRACIQTDARTSPFACAAAVSRRASRRRRGGITAASNRYRGGVAMMVSRRRRGKPGRDDRERR